MIYYQSSFPLESRMFEFNGKKYLYREFDGKNGITKVLGEVPSDFTLDRIRKIDSKQIQEEARHGLDKLNSTYCAGKYVPDYSIERTEFIKKPNYGEIGKTELLGIRTRHISKDTFNNLDYSKPHSYVGITYPVELCGRSQFVINYEDKNGNSVEIAPLKKDKFELENVENIRTELRRNTTWYHCIGNGEYNHIANITINADPTNHNKEEIPLETVFKQAKRLLKRFQNRAVSVARNIK